MKPHECGLWIPDVMEGPHAYQVRAQQLEDILPRIVRARSVVQAGGHIGLYPMRLAQWFERVYTFEPEPRNFECLFANCAHLANVYPLRAALGYERGTVHLRVRETKTGAHSVKGEGPWPSFRIDDLGLTDCDAIFLDTEGFEVPALTGALDTIGRSRPVIVAEENKKLRGYGRAFGDIERLLAPLRYARVAQVGEDLVLVPR